jgi:hypothetical protein
LCLTLFIIIISYYSYSYTYSRPTVHSSHVHIHISEGMHLLQCYMTFVLGQLFVVISYS